MHPSYPNPTVVEAACDVRFRLSENNPWKPTTVGEFFLGINREFPDMEPLQTMDIEFQIGPSGFSHKVVPTAMNARFKNPDGKRLINLGEGAVSASILKPYSGWESMKQHVQYTWEHTHAILGPTTVTRVGLRYINVIPLNDPNEPAAVWLLANDFIPKSLVQSKRGILFRSDFQLDEHNRMIIQLADRIPDETWPNGSIVFDIDRIREVDGTDMDVARLLGLCDSLHDDVWNIFDSSLTKQYRQFLEGHR